MRRSWHLAITSIVAAVLATLPTTTAAAASAVLTVGSSGGPAVSAGDILWGVLVGNAVFTNGSNTSQKITCTSSRIDGVVNSNPPPPGQATFTITSWTFGSCSISGVSGASVTGITTNATSSCPYNATVSDSSSSNNVTISAATGSGCSTIMFTVGIIVFGTHQSCVYSPHNGSLTGSWPVGGSSITFSNQSLNKSSGPGTCFSSLAFSATYSVTDHTQGGGAVVLN